MAISGRPLHLGLGAGTSPTSRWAAEMHAVGQPIIETIEARHGQLGVVLDVLDRVDDPDRRSELATFPLPVPRPLVLVGVNSVALATLAGARADGVNVDWVGRRRDELLGQPWRRGDRPGFLLTAWAFWSPDLADPSSSARRAMDDRGIDRLVLVVPVGVGPGELGRSPHAD